MTELAGSVTPQWLTLREPADARARSGDLAQALAADLLGAADDDHPTLWIHDLGSGSGSMGRWLAPRLRAAQHWVLHDRDPTLLELAAAAAPTAPDGLPVTVSTVAGDLARLTSDRIEGASLVTASALLDILTAAEVDHLVAVCVAAGVPALLTLSVTGRVRLAPSEPMDEVLARAFNDHQRRTTAGRTLLGTDAPARAMRRFAAAGAHVTTAASPWRLTCAQPQLVEEWLTGWVGAACEQRPELTEPAEEFRARRLAQLAGGRLEVEVGHVDLLARPRRTR